MGMEMGKTGITGMGKTGIPMPLLLLALSALGPTTGTIQAPLLILEGPEQDGIRLRCLSDRPFPEVRLLWTDGNGENLTGIPSPGDGGNAGSSLLLRPGAGNAAACRVLEPRLSAAAESSVVIGDVFFPSTSPWLPAFVMLLIFGIVLILAAAYKIRRNNQIMARERKTEQEIREEIEDLNDELEEEKKKFQKENQEMVKKIEHIQAQLDFRRAQSHAVTLTMDKRCTHPSLAIRGQSRILSPNSAPQTHPRAVAVAREGFSQGQRYWEVEVEAEVGGDGSGWELGVVAEEIRDSLRTSGAELPEVKGRSSGAGFPEEKVLGLGYSRGEFRLPGGKLERTSGMGSPEVTERSSGFPERTSGTGSPEVMERSSGFPERTSGMGSPEVTETISGFPEQTSGMGSPEVMEPISGFPEQTSGMGSPEVTETISGFPEQTSGMGSPEVTETISGFPEQTSGMGSPEVMEPISGFPEQTSGMGSPEVTETISGFPERTSGMGSPEVMERSSGFPERTSGMGSPEVTEGISGFSGGSSGRFCVVGVFLDLEFHTLSFFDAEEKRLLGSVPVKISGKLFPFFRPGGNSMGVRSVGV